MHYFIRYIFIVFVFIWINSPVVSAQSNSKSTSTTENKKSKDFGKRFFEKDSIHSIRIYFNQCNYFDSLTYYKKIEDSLEIPTYMQTTVTIDGKQFYSCGVRYKGESSYQFYPGKKKPFRIKFDKFIKGQDFQGLKDLNLTNNFRDPTMIREKIYLDLMNSYGLPAPRATFAKVYINDKYFGLYLVNENIDDIFLETRFQDSRGNLFQGEPLANFVYLGNDQAKYYSRYVLKSNTKKNDWSDLVKFIKLINDTVMKEDEFLKKLEANFDLDKCLRAWAINNLIGNIDAYNMFFPHNFFIYHDSTQFKWHWISLDGNYAFAAWNPVMNYPQLTRMNVMMLDSLPYKDERPLLMKTLGKNKVIQKRYLFIVRQLMNAEFQQERMNRVIDSLALRIRVAVYADVNKMYSNADFDANLSNALGDPLDPGNFIPGLKSFLNDRRRNLEIEIEELSRFLN